MDNDVKATDAPCIAPDELAELQQFRMQTEQTTASLGMVTRQMHNLERQKGELHNTLDSIVREEERVVNRLARKYNMPENARIDLGTGAIT